MTWPYTREQAHTLCESDNSARKFDNNDLWLEEVDQYKAYFHRIGADAVRPSDEKLPQDQKGLPQAHCSLQIQKHVPVKLIEWEITNYRIACIGFLSDHVACILLNLQCR